jgi:hypothetical protein
VLERALAEVDRPVREPTVRVPLSREAIHACERELHALATAVAGLERPRTHGLAIAFLLAFDGGGALFLRPETRDGRERLANTIQAALAALGVSAEFDQPQP